MRKFKSFVWASICCYLASVSTYKLTYLYFLYVASTNDTTAPFAAFVTAIPFGYAVFLLTSAFYRNIIKMTRKTLHAIAWSKSHLDQKSKWLFLHNML